MFVRSDWSCSSGAPVVELLFARGRLDQVRHLILNINTGGLHQIKLGSHAAQERPEQMNSRTHSKEKKQRRRRTTTTTWRAIHSWSAFHSIVGGVYCVKLRSCAAERRRLKT